ncbi:UNVERIFIED_ORG: hypothetical protein ABIC54_006453 [Burkholderia sp. 1263]
MITLPSTWGQWLAAIVALLLAPAIGSAFWEFLAKPLLVGTTDRIRNACMRLLTLGSRHAQKRFFEAVGHRRLLHPAVAFWRIAYYATALFAGSTLAAILRAEHISISPRSWQIYFIFAGAVFAGALATYRYGWTSLVDNYIRRFDYSMELLAPLMNEQERLLLRAQFAGIDSPEAYKDLLRYLGDVVSVRKVKLTGTAQGLFSGQAYVASSEQDDKA